MRRQWHRDVLLLWTREVTEDEAAAERRLVPTARMQANALADLLLTLRKHLFGLPPDRSELQGAAEPPGSAASEPPCTAAQASRLRKRACRMADIEALTKEMKEHIRASADHMYAMIDLGKEPRPLQRLTKAAKDNLNDACASSCCFPTNRQLEPSGSRTAEAALEPRSTNTVPIAPCTDGHREKPGTAAACPSRLRSGHETSFSRRLRFVEGTFVATRACRSSRFRCGCQRQ